MGYKYFCKYTPFFRIAREAGVGTTCKHFYIMQMILLLRIIFDGIKVVPLTTLTA